MQSDVANIWAFTVQSRQFSVIINTATIRIYAKKKKKKKKMITVHLDFKIWNQFRFLQRL